MEEEVQGIIVDLHHCSTKTTISRTNRYNITCINSTSSSISEVTAVLWSPVLWQRPSGMGSCPACRRRFRLLEMGLLVVSRRLGRFHATGPGPLDGMGIARRRPRCHREFRRSTTNTDCFCPAIRPVPLASRWRLSSFAAIHY